VYGSERHVLLRHYLEAGLTKTAIAQRLGLDRSTIYRWLRAGALDRDLDAEACTTGPARRHQVSSIPIAPCSKRASQTIPISRRSASLPKSRRPGTGAA
jgi:transposase-like protein